MKTPKEEMPKEPKEKEPCFFCGKSDGKHKPNCPMVKTAEDYAREDLLWK